MDISIRNRIQKLRQAVRNGKSRILTKVVVDGTPTEVTVSGVSFRTLENGQIVVKATTVQKDTSEVRVVETDLDSFFRYL